MMKVFKKIVLYLAFLGIFVGVPLIIINKVGKSYRANIEAAKPCRTPLKYALGKVDPRFDMTQDKLRSEIAGAAEVWNKAAGRTLFEYDPSASLQIQMIYDERQQAVDDGDQLEAELKTLTAQRTTLDKQYSGLTTEYNQKLAAFKAAVEDYRKKIADYNNEVSRWNSLGGAPESEYNKLTKEKKSLDSTLKKIKAQESDLNDLAKQINAIAAKESKMIKNYNAAVSTYQDKYGGSREFEKGVFDPKLGISIYEFQGMDDLQLTLIHELGHALGLQHVQNPQSIMYYLMGAQDLNNPALTAEDKVELNKICQL